MIHTVTPEINTHLATLVNELRFVGACYSIDSRSESPGLDVQKPVLW